MAVQERVGQWEPAIVVKLVLADDRVDDHDGPDQGE
jgi:hypothetical protein